MPTPTDELIDRFAVALTDNLRAAEEKYGWDGGWTDPAAVDAMRESLYEHLDNGDPRDVAAYCAFLWHHGASTAFPEPPEPARCERCGDSLTSDEKRFCSPCLEMWDWRIPEQYRKPQIGADHAGPS